MELVGGIKITGLLRPEQSGTRETAGVIHAGLPSDPARSSERASSIVTSTLQRAGNHSRRRAGSKVIDFGIAKAHAGTADGHKRFSPLLTVFGHARLHEPRAGAVGGVDVDTRSDIYSLGVVALRAADGGNAV
jgi:hypothetical protein